MNLGGGIGWNFPPLGGGEGQGFEHAGMAHFQGDLLGSLAREVIQNSLDARLGEVPVAVTFEMRHLDLRRDLDGDELRRHIVACREFGVREGRKREVRFFDTAEKLLSARTVPFLCISDRNTTGLRRNEWTALVKRQGESAKRDGVSGGSFGIGKNAPFAVSPLRTVCYWTCSEEDGRLTEKFQAKAILMTHEWSSNGRKSETQGTGYYGVLDDCREIVGRAIPRAFRMRSRGEPIPGTAVWIAGFQTGQRETGNLWQRAVARSVLRNYFHAIERGALNVLLEPDGLPHEEHDAYAELGDKALQGAFRHLQGDDDLLGEAAIYWSMIRNGAEETFNDDLKGLGRVKLWVKTEDDCPGEALPCKVALIRGTGMLVTDHQSGLRQFRSLRDFAAICVLESDEANALLRRMENPAHDQFEPDRLSAEEYQSGVNALRGLTRWIRDRLHEVAAPRLSSVSEELDELATFLPLDAPGPLAGPPEGSAAEKAFGVAGEVLRKAPKRRIRPSRLETETEDAFGGDGNESGDYGGGADGEGHRQGGGNGGRGEGDRSGGTGVRGGLSGRGPVGIRDVRILSEDGTGRRFRVTFTPEVTGRVRLALEEAGDSTAQPLDGIVLRALNNREVTEGVTVKAERRHSLRLESETPMKGVALRLTAHSEGNA